MTTSGISNTKAAIGWTAMLVIVFVSILATVGHTAKLVAVLAPVILAAAAFLLGRWSGIAKA